jgi:RHS repeat-associated protein
VPAQAQNIAGEPGAGIVESGSLSLANALAAVALDPSTGVLTSRLPIDSPAARGVPQPGLELNYNSAAGIREAGVGWGLNLPTIERRNRDGAPRYLDPDFTVGNMPGADHFVFDGKPLVPICVVKLPTCVNSISPPANTLGTAALPLPTWATDGWMYFRLQTDDSRARFFWSANHRTWRVQFAGGEILELGVPLARPQLFSGPIDVGIDFDAVRCDSRLPTEQYDIIDSDSTPWACMGQLSLARHPFRWNAVRRFDANEHVGSPANLVAYRWVRMGSRERGFLTDVYDTPPADTQDILNSADFAHHVHLTWDAPPFLRGLAMPGFRATPDLRVVRIDVTSQPFQKNTRQLLRRYYVGYVSEGSRYYLSTYETEGRCAPVDELADGTLPVTNCGRLPATRLRYSRREYATRAGGIWLPSPPAHGQGKPIPVAVLDVNGDSLPDFVETKEADPPGVTQKLHLNGLNGPWFASPVTITGPANVFSKVGQTVTGSINTVMNGPAALLWHASEAATLQAIPDDMWGGGKILTASRDPAGAWSWACQTGVDTYAGMFHLPDKPVPLSVVGDVDGDGLADGVFFYDEPATHAGSSIISQKLPRMVTLSFGAFRENQGDCMPPVCHLEAPVSVEHLVEICSANYTRPRFRMKTAQGPTPEMVSKLDWTTGDRAAALVDMNGDGLGDLAFITLNIKSGEESLLGVRYWPGDGRGNFTGCTTDGCPWPSPVAEAPSVSFKPIDIGPAGLLISSDSVALADVNGDGLADLVLATPDGVNIYWNVDGRYWNGFEPNLSIPASHISVHWKEYSPKPMQFADMNGNGLTDVVFIVGDEIAYIDVQDYLQQSGYGLSASAPRPGLLISVDNGLGASTDIHYVSTADLARSKGTAANPWMMPQVLQVVGSVTVKSGLPGDDWQTITYDYDNPAFDGKERRFRGFRNVSATRALGNGTVRVDDTYYIADPDVAWHAPLLIVSELSDGHGHYRSKTIRSYRVQDGLPGGYATGGSQAAYPERIDTILYDTAAWSPSDGTIPVAVTGKGGEVIWSGTVPVSSRSNAHIRMEQRLDDLGNVVWHADRGHIRDDGNPIDEPIIRTVEMNPPFGNWKFLPKSVTVAPFNGSVLGLPRQRRFEYDGLGRLTKVFATLTGTVPLDRRHENPLKLVAGTPSSASKDGEVLISRHTYDDFGNLTLVEGANDRCAATEFDRDYASLAQRNIAFTGGCGKGPLASVNEWDRGFATVVSASRPDGSASRTEFDDFGRVIAAYAPDPVTGQPSSTPASRVEYHATAGGPAQGVKVVSAQGGGRTHTSWTYMDSLGRTLLALDEADPSAGDEGQWVVSKMQRRYNGLVVAVYEPWFYSGDPATPPLGAPPSKSTQYQYEPFGRVSAIEALDGTITHRRVYRALGVEDVDAAGRVKATTLNGHGRMIHSVVQTPSDDLKTDLVYEVDGELASVLQFHSADSTTVERWFQYDSLGRMVLNKEPNTSTKLSGPPIWLNHAWVYAYDDSGQLVATSDARGCGKNIHHDGLGRVVAEDYSPCLSSQPDYTPMDPSTGVGAEVIRNYDTPEAGQTTDFGVSAAILKGRLTAARSRGVHDRYAYDARGRVVGLARQVAQPTSASGLISYEVPWSRMSLAYDEADRLVGQTTGADVAELLDANGQSVVNFGYTDRGFIRTIGGSYGPLLAGEIHAADNLTTSRLYADAAGTLASFTYDARRRVTNYGLKRAAAGPWIATPGYTPPTQGPNTLQRVILDHTFGYDAVSNLTLVRDNRIADEWPSGAAPVTRTMAYDALDRLSRVDYTYPAGSDTQIDPYAYERSNGRSPVPASTVPNRVAWQTFGFDWLGNLATTGDDGNVFYDRSLGTITHGSFNLGPNQIQAAGPNLQIQHDEAGNLVDMVVQRSGPCTGATGCVQRFVYDWDEVGQLARARRWDFASSDGMSVYPTLPGVVPAADLRYIYDGTGARVLTSTITGGGEARHNAEIFPSLRLDRTTWDDAAQSYVRNPDTEIVYLADIGRLAYGTGLPSPNGDPKHVLLRLPDQLGSIAAVIDRDTGELVERTSQQIYGAPDSDFRPERWAGLRDLYQFTGKETDLEVGLTYFGARYYNAALGRFISPDPLTIHAAGGGANPYAYVSGSPASMVDPAGLEDECSREQGCRQGSEPPVEVTVEVSEPEPPTSAPAPPSQGQPRKKGPSVTLSARNPEGSPPSAAKVLVGGLRWVANALLAANPPVAATVAAVQDPVGAAEGYVKGLQEALLGPGMRLANTAVTPAVAGAVTGQHIAIDKKEVGIASIDLAITLVTMGRGGAVASEARAVAAEAAAAETAEGNQFTRSNRQYDFPPGAKNRWHLPKGTPCPACQAEEIAEGDHFDSKESIRNNVDMGMMTPEEGKEFARRQGNFLSLCRTCNNAKGAKPMGNLPGYWPPPNPVPWLLDHLKKIGSVR